MRRRPDGIEPPDTADLADFVRELRALAAPARSAVDALTSCWYLDFRARTGRSYAQWADAATRPVAAAVLFHADARPALGVLGGVRAVQGMSEVEVHDDIAALVRASSDGAFLDHPLPEPEELVDAALAGWYAASRATRPLVWPGATGGEGDLCAALRSWVTAAAGAGGVRPLLVVVDIVGPDAAADPNTIRGLLPALTAEHWPDARWFELRTGHRYVGLADATRSTTCGLAALRGGLRVAPELAGTRVWVWLEQVPVVPEAIDLFVACLVGRPRAQRELQSHTRSRPRHEAHSRGRSEHRHRLTLAALERWTMAAAAFLAVMVLAGSLGTGLTSTTESAEPPDRPPAGAEAEPEAPAAVPDEAVDPAVPDPALTPDDPAPAPGHRRSRQVTLAPVPVSHVVEPIPAASPVPEVPASGDLPEAGPAPAGGEPGAVGEPAVEPPVDRPGAGGLAVASAHRSDRASAHARSTATGGK